MLNNLKSVTLFPIFFKKNFLLFFLCPPDDMPQDAAATRWPFFQAKRAKINKWNKSNPSGHSAGYI